MVRINEDNLVVLVNTVLVDPVRVQDTEVTASLADTLLRNALKTSLRLQVVDTLADGLAVSGTLGDLLFAVTPAYTDTVDDIALLGLVAETTSPVGARRAGCTVDNIQLTVLPAAMIVSSVQFLEMFSYEDLVLTAHGGGNGGHPTASFCTTRRYTCMRPSCELQRARQRMSQRLNEVYTPRVNGRSSVVIQTPSRPSSLHNPSFVFLDHTNTSQPSLTASWHSIVLTS